MSKKNAGARSGMDWRLVSQNVAIGVAIVLLSPLVAYLAMQLPQLPLVDVLAVLFVPFAFIVIMTYSRSGQRTKGQAIAEGVFAGFIFLVVMTLVSFLFSFFGSQAA